MRPPGGRAGAPGGVWRPTSPQPTKPAPVIRPHLESETHAWLPAVSANLDYDIPTGLGGAVDVKADAGDDFANLNFAGAVAATVRYDLSSVLTDILYVSADAA